MSVVGKALCVPRRDVRRMIAVFKNTREDVAIQQLASRVGKKVRHRKVVPA